MDKKRRGGDVVFVESVGSAVYTLTSNKQKKELINEMSVI